MAEYIDANKKVTIQVYNDMTEEWHKVKVTIAEVLDKWTDEGCPKRVEAEPIKHGRWEFIGATTRGAAIINRYACSECGYEADTTNYCPNCGARMDAQIGEDKSHPFAESVMMGMDGEENEK